MKRGILAAALPLLVVSGVAHAAGIGIRWNDCDGVSNRTFSCQQNTGEDTFVGFFDPPGGVNQMSGIEVSITFSAGDAALPNWWQLRNAGACRSTSLSCSFDFSTGSSCTDAWSGQGTGGIAAYTFGSGGPSTAKILMVCAVPPSALVATTAGTRYSAFKVTIRHDRSSGAGACAGCNQPVCISLDQINITQPDRPDPMGPSYHRRDHLLTDDLPVSDGVSTLINWQGGTGRCATAQSQRKITSWGGLKDRFK